MAIGSVSVGDRSVHGCKWLVSYDTATDDVCNSIFSYDFLSFG